MTSITSSSSDAPDRPIGSKRKASTEAPDNPFSHLDCDDKHPGVILSAVNRQMIELRRSNCYKRTRHAPTLQGVSPLDVYPVDNDSASSPPHLVVQQSRRFHGDINNQVEQPASPISTQLVIPSHYHSGKDDDKDVQAAGAPPTSPLPAVHRSQASSTSLSASCYHYRHNTHPTPFSSSSPDPIVGPSPYKPVAHTPSSARHGNGNVEEIAQRSRSRNRRDGRDGRDNEEQRSSPTSRRAFVVAWRRPEAAKEEDEENDIKSGCRLKKEEEEV
ncbi:unnamed protein product [Zymoseptoria tritici ST99CH_1E4]|uniref:Uncharacterized protein n=1 Tax=Zymoseptoria tritici ST99CH_1E4 TaxID=1276532 RepID=A0A2H1H982_ZYMTR|nr:unnamed protein product [Zymoseptoria tritici ST99CH_1E4]